MEPTKKITLEYQKNIYEPEHKRPARWKITVDGNEESAKFFVLQFGEPRAREIARLAAEEYIHATLNYSGELSRVERYVYSSVPPEAKITEMKPKTPKKADALPMAASSIALLASKDKEVEFDPQAKKLVIRKKSDEKLPPGPDVAA